MSIAQGYGIAVTSGSVFWLDFGDPINCFLGAPTTNVFGDVNFIIYDNVPADVGASVVRTGEFYRGAPVWKATYIPRTATGMTYLQNGNNPGIGVLADVTSWPANTYCGASIFYRSTTPMYVFPTFNNYSNMQNFWNGNTYTTYDDMGDGWFRAWTTGRSGSVGSDSKYWAINPQPISSSSPIVVYWAGMFKETQNRQFVSPYALGTRNITSSMYPLVGSHVIDLTSASYDLDGTLAFNGVSNFIRIPNNTNLDSPQITVESIFMVTGSTQNGFIFEKGTVNSQYSNMFEDVGFKFRTNGLSVQDTTFPASILPLNRWNHVISTYANGSKIIYLNGVQVAITVGVTGTLSTNAGGMSIGAYNGYNEPHSYYFNGKIAVVKVYRRDLSPSEVQQNYNFYKSRFNLP